MTKRIFDIIMIFVMAAFLSIVVLTNTTHYYVEFSMIPLMTCYFLGQYSQKRFGNTGK